MSNILQIKSRITGDAGAPSGLKPAELAYNMVDDIVYIGKGEDGGGNATSVVPIAGSGAFTLLNGSGFVAKSGDTMTGALIAPEFNVGGYDNTGFTLKKDGSNVVFRRGDDGADMSFQSGSNNVGAKIGSYTSGSSGVFYGLTLGRSASFSWTSNALSNLVDTSLQRASDGTVGVYQGDGSTLGTLRADSFELNDSNTRLRYNGGYPEFNTDQNTFGVRTGQGIRLQFGNGYAAIYGGAVTSIYSGYSGNTLGTLQASKLDAPGEPLQLGNTSYGAEVKKLLEVTPGSTGTALRLNYASSSTNSNSSLYMGYGGGSTSFIKTGNARKLSIAANNGLGASLFLDTDGTSTFNGTVNVKGQYASNYITLENTSSFSKVQCGQELRFSTASGTPVRFDPGGVFGASLSSSGEWSGPHIQNLGTTDSPAFAGITLTALDRNLTFTSSGLFLKGFVPTLTLQHDYSAGGEEWKHQANVNGYLINRGASPHLELHQSGSTGFYGGVSIGSSLLANAAPINGLVVEKGIEAESYYFHEDADDPTTSDIPSGTSAVYKNTTSGHIHHFANNDGTIVEVIQSTVDGGTY